MFGERKTVVDLFRKPPEPKELVRKWQADIRAENRKLERSIRELQRGEASAQKSIKEAAKRGDIASAKILAKEVVHTRSVVKRMYTNRAHLMSMNTQLSQQLALAKVAGTLKKSTEVMTLVNDLIKAPQLMQTMQQMSREMAKAGVIEEVMADSLDDALDTEDLEEQTEAEVDKVLLELTGETLAVMANAPRTKVGQAQAAPEQAQEQEEDASLVELQQRLAAVRS